jgi:3-hydroxyisobutyrate dehydrogenase
MTRLGLIGTGLMGAPLAMRLLAADPLTVYNRTVAKTTDLAAAGAQVAATAAQVFEQSDVIVLMLTDATAIATMLFESGAALAGKTVIQMGTIAPAQSVALHDQIKTAGGEYLEAPVLGSIPEATAGNLIVMVGSTMPQFEQWRSLLQQFGPQPTWIGTVGSAATLKLALNQLIGALTTSFGLSLAMIQQAGIDPDRFMGILRESALYAPTFDKKLHRMLHDDYSNPNFPVQHLLKDLTLCASTASQQGLDASSIVPIQALLAQTIAAGLGAADYSALFSQLRHPQLPPP